MTTTTVSSGTSVYQTVSAGNVLDVTDTAITVDTLVQNGGSEVSFAGGQTVAAVVQSGGQEVVSSGGAALSTLLSGGKEIVSSGGVTSDATFLGAGELDLYAGAVVSGGIALTTGGTLTLEGSAVPNLQETAGPAYHMLVTSNATFVDAGTLNVRAGGDGASLDVTDGATVHNTGLLDISGAPVPQFLGNPTGAGEVSVASAGKIVNGGTLFVGGGSSGEEGAGGGAQLLVSSGGTLSNTGSVEVRAGSEGDFDGGGGATLVADSGRITNEGTLTVDGEGGTDFTAGTAGSVTLSGGTTFRNDGSVDLLGGGAGFEPGNGAALTIDSGSQLIDDGSIVVEGGRAPAQIYDGVSGGPATLTISAGGTLQLEGNGVLTDEGQLVVATSNGLRESGRSGVLLSGGSVDLQFLDYSTGPFSTGGSATLDTDTDFLIVREGGASYGVQLVGDYSGLYFHATADGTGGTLVTEDSVACYVAGTRIQTVRGEMPVETLAIGDRVVTGAGRCKPVRWLGRRSYAGRFLASNLRLHPVRLRAGSLGDGLPRRDLLVSPEHGMWLDGVLVAARHLVNGATIVQEHGLARVDYLHVELDDHDVILAEGAPSESYLDDGSRGAFGNAAEWAALYPDRAAGPATFCAPRLESGAALETIRQRLRGLAGGMARAA